MVGAALARSIASPQVEDRDQLAIAVGDALTEPGWSPSTVAPPPRPSW